VGATKWLGGGAQVVFSIPSCTVNLTFWLGHCLDLPFTSLLLRKNP